MKEVNIDNYVCYIGENKNENDKLVRDARLEQRGNDIWIHMTEYPSAHCIIMNPNNDRISNKILKKFAIYMKVNSKYKTVNKLEFDIMKIKNVIPTDTIGQMNLVGNIKTIMI